MTQNTHVISLFWIYHDRVARNHCYRTNTPCHCRLTLKNDVHHKQLEKQIHSSTYINESKDTTAQTTVDTCILKHHHLLNLTLMMLSIFFHIILI